jgi:prepilin-type processing-associated H-X9-DG protein
LGFGSPGAYGHPYLANGPLHRAGENAAFCDGHVESANSENLPTTTNAYGGRVFEWEPTRAQRWNHDNKPHPETRPQG